MQMRELAAASGVPVPTIKYYLREGLLPPGEATAATRASYDDGHLARLRLIRALVAVGGLSLERVRAVLELIDAQADARTAIGAAHGQLSEIPGDPPTEHARKRVADIVRRRRWRLTGEGRHAAALAAALDAMEQAGQPMSAASLTAYADAAVTVARADLAAMGQREAADAVTFAITGTVLAEPVLLALRRMAQEDLAARGRISRPR